MSQLLHEQLDDRLASVRQEVEALNEFAPKLSEYRSVSEAV